MKLKRNLGCPDDKAIIKLIEVVIKWLNFKDVAQVMEIRKKIDAHEIGTNLLILLRLKNCGRVGLEQGIYDIFQSILDLHFPTNRFPISEPNLN